MKKLLASFSILSVLIFFYPPSVYAANIIDSYTTNPAANGDNLRTGGSSKRSQVFYNTSADNLGSVTWKLKKTGSPTGNAVAKVYAITGTPGTNGLPTGAALATSDNLDTSTISASGADVNILFSGANQIALSATTYYAVTLEWAGTGNSADQVDIEDNQTAVSYANHNSGYYISSWNAIAGTDFAFYYYVYDNASAPIASNFGILTFFGWW